MNRSAEERRFVSSVHVVISASYTGSSGTGESYWLLLYWFLSCWGMTVSWWHHTSSSHTGDRILVYLSSLWHHSGHHMPITSHWCISNWWHHAGSSHTDSILVSSYWCISQTGDIMRVSITLPCICTKLFRFPFLKTTFTLLLSPLGAEGGGTTVVCVSLWNTEGWFLKQYIVF